eukprot:CAMPEP_0174240704 /NCGR_PEP_ID=MMETSP0417-20130205/20152_1 /TAXON_ID=242541 /ORGANISM="Mayorella sp, Strain BSH-02190019" /LENGTH=261 /DNA_ID=CAMNT_0015319839 /DNA_START=785 /DNA_END=1566 /DNA_ORIENTATION=-
MPRLSDSRSRSPIHSSPNSTTPASSHTRPLLSSASPHISHGSQASHRTKNVSSSPSSSSATSSSPTPLHRKSQSVGGIVRNATHLIGGFAGQEAQAEQAETRARGMLLWPAGTTARSSQESRAEAVQGLSGIVASSAVCTSLQAPCGSASSAGTCLQSTQTFAASPPPGSACSSSDSVSSFKSSSPSLPSASLRLRWPSTIASEEKEKDAFEELDWPDDVVPALGSTNECDVSQARVGITRKVAEDTDDDHDAAAAAAAAA